MLVLSRRVDERILIGEDIVITIVRANAHLVRIGIDAPAHTPIRREELLEIERLAGDQAADREEAPVV